ncbi:MAG: hypothetical protein H6830_11610 [Planctomycetes bacterium]|nr:hypothetical protein [Planctomycetota bacterium]
MTSNVGTPRARMRPSTFHLLPTVSLLLAGTCLGQGDSCGTAAALSALGSFAFDTSGLSTSGFQGGGGCASGATSIHQDGFWQWTAPAAGDFDFDTFGSSFDTKLAVHAGIGCSAICTAYNDDTGGLQSMVSLTGLSAGDQVLIQVGGFGVSYGPGLLNITQRLDPCVGAIDDPWEDNDDCASAPPLADGTYLNLFASRTDPDHFAFTVAAGDTVHIDVVHPAQVGDLDAFLWDAQDVQCGSGYGSSALVSGFTSSDDENLVWTNSTGADMAVVLEVQVWAASPGNCNHYDLVVAGASGRGIGSAGTPFCDPMDPNSTGVPTVMTASFGSGTGSGLHLEALDGPPGQFGYFLVGNAASDPGIVVSQGRLCLAIDGGNALGRYNLGLGEGNSLGIFDAAGVLQNLLGTSATGSGFDVPASLPLAGSPTLHAGDTWHFQLWHRESAGASNFSNGLSVVF